MCTYIHASTTVCVVSYVFRVLALVPRGHHLPLRRERSSDARGYCRKKKRCCRVCIMTHIAETALSRSDVLRDRTVSHRCLAITSTSTSAIDVTIAITVCTASFSFVVPECGSVLKRAPTYEML